MALVDDNVLGHTRDLFFIQSNQQDQVKSLNIDNHILKLTQNSSDPSKNRKTAQFLVSSQASDAQYQLKKGGIQSSILDTQQDINLLTRLEILEKEMKSLIEKNIELQQIVMYFQANLSRLSIQNLRGSVYQKGVNQNDYLFLDQSRNFSYGTDNDILNMNIKKEGGRDLTNYLGSIEEEEIQQNKDSMVEINKSETLLPPKPRQNYHEDLMRNIEYQIIKVFKIVNSKFGPNSKLNVSLEERKRDTIGSRGNIFNGIRRSQTPHQFDRSKLLLKDSFNNNGGGTGSASGQYFVNNHNFGAVGVRQSNASQKNVLNNFGISPSSPTMNNLLGNDPQANQIYYATSEVSRDENNDNSSSQFKNRNTSKKQFIRILPQQDPNTVQARMSSQSRRISPNAKALIQSQSQLLNTNYLNDMHSFNDLSGNLTKQYNSQNRSGGASYNQFPNLDQTQGSLPNFEEPMKWIPNERSSNCQICSKIFNIFRRKHHCRGCGILICGKCSPEKDYVAGYKDKKVRICRNCDLTKQRRKTETGKLNVFTSAKTIAKIK